MATMPAVHPRRFTDDAYEDYFAPQRTSSTELPDPEPFLRNVAIGVLEVFAGVREVEQLARWVTEDSFRKLVVRVQPRRARPQRPRHPRQAPGPHDPLGASLVTGGRRGRGCRRRERAPRAPAPWRCASKAWTVAGARPRSPCSDPRPAAGLPQRCGSPLVLLVRTRVDQVEQRLERVADLGVVELTRPALPRDHSAAVHPPEVAERERVRALRLAVLGLVDPEVPVRILGPSRRAR